MKKFGTLLIILIAAIGGIYFQKTLHATSPAPKQILSTQSKQPTSTPIPPTIITTDTSLPKTISIPQINVSANIESVGMDKQGRMDIPQKADNVAWYNLGYKPGEKGNAVIDGHLDKQTGAPAVFWNLKKLQPGDKIIVTDTQGTQKTFSVIKTINYPYNQFPLKQVFGPADQPLLNLITCEGQWDKTTKNYSHRTVVYAQLVQ